MNRAILALAIAAACGAAQAETDSADQAKTLDRVVVVGTREQAALQPGSATVLEKNELESSRVTTVRGAAQGSRRERAR